MKPAAVGEALGRDAHSAHQLLIARIRAQRIEPAVRLHHLYGDGRVGEHGDAQQTVTVRPFNSNTACTVSGAGWIDAGQPKYFAIAVRHQAGWSVPQGGVVYADTQAHQYLQSLTIARLTCAGTHAEIAGTALTLAGSVPFTVQLDDRGARDAGDAFAIQWPGYQAAKPLGTRDVAIRIP